MTATPERLCDGVTLFEGDALEVASRLPAGSVRCVVTSPPYWGGLRDYDHPAQLGLERNPADYVAKLVEVFRAAARALAADGTLWLNVGDVYAASGKGGGGSRGHRKAWETVRERKGFRMPPAGFKMKDLTLTPFALADALRSDGWYLRQTVVWSKPTAVEPMRADRPATSHEYVFLFSQSESYRCSDPGGGWWGRSVWEIAPESHPRHPAAMPTELARRCVLSSTDEGDTVFDPFAGSGTVLALAYRKGRRAVGCDLNPEYLEVIRRRVAHAAGAGSLFAGTS